MRIGIGLNYGPAVLGDIGSTHSMSFTVIGDTVNTASRLQTLTRALGTPLVIGDRLVQALKAGLSEIDAEVVGQLQDQGEQVLRGRAGAVRVWTCKAAERIAAPERRDPVQVGDAGQSTSEAVFKIEKM